MPYINVNDVYILDNTGKQVDDAVDYALANSNRNLLDNPWFTVNQRGYTNGSASNDFVADRWFLYGASDLTVANSGNGLVLTGTAGGRARIRHHIDEKVFIALYGQTLTFSIKINGQVYAFPFTVVSSYPTEQIAMLNSSINTSVGRIDAVVTWQISTNKVLVYFSVYQAMTIQAVKLELGSYSTLANDAPPDYAEELSKCQQYFIRLKNSVWTIFGSGYASSATNLRVLIPLPVTMRATPTRSYSGSFVVMGNGSNSLAVTNMTVGSVTANGLEMGVTTSGMTLYQTYHLVSQDTTAYLDLSADL